MSLENTWLEIRDHFLHTESLQILQIHISMLVLLLFSSPHSISVGFSSEDRDNHGKILILCSVTHFCVYFDVCFGLLSCWNFFSLIVLNSSGGFAAKMLLFQLNLTIEASDIWSSSRVWQLNLLEFVFGRVRIIFLETLPDNMWWYRVYLIFNFLGFWPQDSTNLYDSTAVIGESLATQTLLLTVH